MKNTQITFSTKSLLTHRVNTKDEMYDITMSHYLDTERSVLDRSEIMGMVTWRHVNVSMNALRSF